MAVRPINNPRGPDGNGGKEGGSGTVRATRRRVIHQIKTPAGIARSQRSEFIQLRFDLFPGPMQRLDLNVVWANQFFVRHQESAIVGQWERAVWADPGRVNCFRGGSISLSLN